MENGFNISQDNNFSNNFKSSKGPRRSGGAFFVPFISGILGASLVLGVCFGVPSIKEKLIGTSNVTYLQSQDTSSEKKDTELNVQTLANYSDTTVEVANKVLPSVVGITIEYKVNTFFGSTTAKATGSGIIISEDGYIVTNNHVIESATSGSYYEVTSANSINVKVYGSDEEIPAEVIGKDEETDLAVIKIDRTDLKPADLGDSTQLRVGEFAMAIGNPIDLPSTVTTGIISAIDREVTAEGRVYNVIQTDAAINSGNSGGALVNQYGEVIGINTLKLSGNGIEGIGFAIPISSARTIIDQLIEFKEVKRPFLGIEYTTVATEDVERYGIPNGLYVESVLENGAAKEAGIEKGDIITKFEGNEVKTSTELNKYKNEHKIGDEVTITVYRKGEYKDLKLTLGEKPEQEETEAKEKEKEQQPRVQIQTVPDSGGSLFDFFGF